MTKQRFWIDDDGENIWIAENEDDMAFPVKYNGFVSIENVQKIVDKMNELSDEIQQLKNQK